MIALGATLPIGTQGYRVGLEGTLASGKFHSSESGSDTDLGTLRTATLQLGLEGPLHKGVPLARRRRRHHLLAGGRRGHLPRRRHDAIPGGRGNRLPAARAAQVGPHDHAGLRLPPFHDRRARRARLLPDAGREPGLAFRRPLPEHPMTARFRWVSRRARPRRRGVRRHRHADPDRLLRVAPDRAGGERVRQRQSLLPLAEGAVAGPDLGGGRREPAGERPRRHRCLATRLPVRRVRRDDRRRLGDGRRDRPRGLGARASSSHGRVCTAPWRWSAPAPPTWTSATITASSSFRCGSSSIRAPSPTRPTCRPAWRSPPLTSWATRSASGSIRPRPPISCLPTPWWTRRAIATWGRRNMVYHVPPNVEAVGP